MSLPHATPAPLKSTYAFVAFAPVAVFFKWAAIAFMAPPYSPISSYVFRPTLSALIRIRFHVTSHPTIYFFAIRLRRQKQKTREWR